MNNFYSILIILAVLLGGCGLWYFCSRFHHHHTGVQNHPRQKAKAVSASPDFFGTEEVWRILWKLSPPVMLSELILALYNICDSCFIGHYSSEGLTALSVIMPIQFLAIAFGLGTGIGVNALMARLYALKRNKTALHAAATGTLAAFIMWGIYAVAIVLFLEPFVRISTQSAAAAKASMVYGKIVCIGSLPLFVEAIWTKIHQAHGDMKIPMYAQIAGAASNILLDWFMIFGIGPFPEMGVAGAAYATVIGQSIAAIITFFGAFQSYPPHKIILPIIRSIFQYAYPQVLRYFSMTFYIVLLNVILARFSDAAITVLGLYYKMQSFLFIPLYGMVTCLVPALSFNFTRKLYSRCRLLIKNSLFVICGFLLIGVLLFEVFPVATLHIFSNEPEVLRLGIPALRIIGISLIPAGLSLTFPTVFQALGYDGKSVLLSLMRQIFTLLPLFYLFSLLGVGYTWIAFPCAEILTGLTGLLLYLHEEKKWCLHA